MSPPSLGKLGFQETAGRRWRPASWTISLWCTSVMKVSVGRISPPFGAPAKLSKAGSMSALERTGTAVERWRSGLDRPHEKLGLRRRVGIEHDADACELRRDLLEQLKPFAADRKLIRAEAREVAAWLRDARDEALRDRIGDL